MITNSKQYYTVLHYIIYTNNQYNIMEMDGKLMNILVKYYDQWS